MKSNILLRRSHKIENKDTQKWGNKMKYKIEEVERDYIEFRIEMEEE